MNHALELPAASASEAALSTLVNLILVADDDPLIRRTLVKQLSKIGYQVALAEDGATALRQAAALNPDVILLDVLMPDMDGFEVCRRLRADSHLAEVPIIMITSLDDRDAYLAGLCAGADDFMRKPVDRIELEIRLYNITRLNRYRRLLQEKERFARLAEMAPIGIVISDPDGQVRFANPAAQTLFASAPDASGERLLLLLNSGAEREAAWRDPEGGFHTVECSMTTTEWEGQPAWLTLLHDITAHKAAEAEREALQRQLLETSRQAGMAEAATGVLHNVGNVLNGITVSAGLIADSLNQSRIPALSKALALLRDCSKPFPPEAQGGRVLDYLDSLAKHLTDERQRLLREFREVRERLDHIRLIIRQQQSDAFDDGATAEPVGVAALVDDAIAMHLISRMGITVQRDYQPLPPIYCEKHKLLQILVNLIRNAQQALLTGNAADRRLAIRIHRRDPDRLRIEVADNGIGIARENLNRIFEFGFTTQSEGHGFSLHASANLARQLGGDLSCHSAGPGCGAAFILELPLNAPEAPPP